MNPSRIARPVSPETASRWWARGCVRASGIVLVAWMTSSCGQSSYSRVLLTGDPFDAEMGNITGLGDASAEGGLGSGGGGGAGVAATGGVGTPPSTGGAPGSPGSGGAGFGSGGAGFGSGATGGAGQTSSGGSGAPASGGSG